MTLTTRHDQIGLATEQLDAAIKLFLNGRSDAFALTLTGADGNYTTQIANAGGDSGSLLHCPTGG